MSVDRCITALLKSLFFKRSIAVVRSSARLWKWLFGSAVAVAAAIPFAGVGDVFGGGPTNCYGSDTQNCTGGFDCSNHIYCTCHLVVNGPGLCEEQGNVCPSYCNVIGS